MKLEAKFLVPLVLFGGLIVLFTVGLKLDPREVPSPLIDKPVPSFNLPTLIDAQERISEATITGHPVALFNVFASWCVACRQEHPFMMQISRSGELPIYGLNYKDQRVDAMAWLERHGNPYIASAHDLDGRVGIDWGVYGVPESFLVDSNGKIRYKVIGPLTLNVWEEKLKPLIAQIRAEQQTGGKAQ